MGRIIPDRPPKALPTGLPGHVQIALTRVGTESEVSTVCLPGVGLEHVGGPYETMVFGGPLDGTQARSATAAGARLEHHICVMQCVTALRRLGRPFGIDQAAENDDADACLAKPPRRAIRLED